MKKALFGLCSVLFVLCCVCSCSTISAVADIAGATGLVDPHIASGVSKSSEAIGKASEEITPQQEYYIGRAVAATIAGRYTVYTAKPDVQRYLNNVLQTLAINSQKPELYKGYHIAILDTDELNAFATSGGHVFISRGLLKTAKNEDELAAVIAHEVGHIELGHSIKAIKNSRFSNALAVTAVSTASVYASAQGADGLADLVSTFGESVSEVVTTLVDKGYSKSQEFDADKASMAILSASGYNPYALIDVLVVMEEKLGNGGGGMGATHPTPQKRIKEAKEDVDDYPPANMKAVALREERFNLAMRSL